MPGAGELRAQIMDLLTQRAFVDSQPIPRNRDQFEQFRAEGRKRLLVVVQDVAKLLPPLFEGFHRVQCALEDAPCGQGDASLDDLRAELSQLVAIDFLSQTPWQWLTQFPRYFAAMLSRIEKLRTGGVRRDEQLMLQVKPHAEKYAQRARDDAEMQRYDAELELFRWMLEEYRVSVFAQHLGTSIKVSPQRLDKQWAKVS
jgi:ATP-dependent helicase HrpA